MRGRTASVVPAVCGILASACGQPADSVVVGSKNFSESILLGEIVAQQLERAGVPVDRKFNLGGFLCHQGLVEGKIDVYVEYTGTAHAAILKLPPERDPVRVRQQVDSIYRERFDAVWTEGLGFENTFAILVRRRDAVRLGIRTISDAVPYMRTWRPVFGYEFTERADGFTALARHYGITLERQPVNMELGLVYRALADGLGDFSSGNSTDGQIAALDLFMLEDDKRFFPPYEAAPVVRRAVLERYPAVRGALATLGGTISGDRMRELNRLVDVEHRPVTEVARQFLLDLESRSASR
ncbi:MAG TPA: glycine betaine ABC transporter substrate-binding protein [Gemmatimonadales bacterium]|nr:glycine betaine ABC transporter substrate-binding protein [Gemmatimonadales bacterium]